METISKEFFGFIKNNSIPAISKIFLGIVIFLSIIFIDNLSGFSYYYGIDSKLSSLQKISALLKDDKLDFRSRQKLVSLQQDILNRKTFKDKFLDHWHDISFVESNNEITNKVKSATNARNSTFEFLSINYFFVLCFFFFPFYWIAKPLVTNFWKNILIVITAEISIVALCFILFFISSLVPTLFGEPIVNYLLNFLIITLFLTWNTLRIKRKNSGYS